VKKFSIIFWYFLFFFVFFFIQYLISRLELGFLMRTFVYIWKHFRSWKIILHFELNMKIEKKNETISILIGYNFDILTLRLFLVWLRLNDLVYNTIIKFTSQNNIFNWWIPTHMYTIRIWFSTSAYSLLRISRVYLYFTINIIVIKYPNHKKIYFSH
jgi:hypothetical protein